MTKSRTPRKSSQDTGTASEFLVMSTLLRQGIDAFITMGNKKSIDIVIKAKIGIAISVDVKAVRDYSSIVVNNVLCAHNHFLVVVIYKGKFENPAILPDCYVIPSEAVAGLTKTFGEEKRLMKGDIIQYRDNWKPLCV